LAAWFTLQETDLPKSGLRLDEGVLETSDPWNDHEIGLRTAVCHALQETDLQMCVDPQESVPRMSEDHQESVLLSDQESDLQKNGHETASPIRNLVDLSVELLGSV
jgi:hypothetical protein